MTHVHEAPSPPPTDLRRLAVPKYDHYVRGTGNVYFESALNAVMRAAETEVPAVSEPDGHRDGQELERAGERLKQFYPWEEIGSCAVVQIFGVRDIVEIEPMRATYSITSSMHDPHYDRVLGVIAGVRNVRGFNRAGGPWRQRLPRLWRRPVRLVPERGDTPGLVAAQQTVLNRLNNGDEVSLLEMLGLRMSLRHYADGPSLP